MRLRLLAGLACSAVAACGGDFAGADFGDGGNGNDAGGSIGCTLTLVPPSVTAVGAPVEVLVTVEGNTFGARSFAWSVDLAGATQNITELSDPADRIAFTPASPGPYRVVVDATVGGEPCLPATTIIGVVASGARTASYRMRVVPLDSAPMQDIPVEIYGGSDAVLPTTVLAAGQLASGRILDNDGAGVAAYLRARLRGTESARDYEAFSDANGDFSLRLPDGRFDVLVVPQQGTLPAAVFSDRAVAEVGTTLSMLAPTTVSGFVLDAAGAAVVGARVSLLVDGARSTEAVSAADGSYSVLAAGSTLTGLAVAPAPGSGMPSLRAEALSGQAVDSASNVLIRYADAAISAQIDITEAGGAVAAGALAEWRADLSNAGSVEVGSVESLSGTLRVLATADASGRVQTALVARDSNLVVHSSDGVEARISRDVPWASAPLTALSLQSLAALPIEATEEGSPLAAAQVVATPLGVLAPQSAVVGGATAGNGTATVGLVQGGSYQVIVSHSVAGEAVALATDVPASPGAVVLDLPGTIVAQGQVMVGAQVAAGAQVRLFCDACPGDDATRVHGSAVADASGRFMIRVADPGVDAL